jgi:hypothetical protein
MVRHGSTLRHGSTWFDMLTNRSVQASSPTNFQNLNVQTKPARFLKPGRFSFGFYLILIPKLPYLLDNDNKNINQNLNIKHQV